MNQLALAICLLGFIALASTAPAPEQCLQLLVGEFIKSKVPEPVSAYVAYLDSVLPADGDHEWDEAEFKRFESVAEYPWHDCDNFVKNVSKIVEEVLAQHNDCADVVNKALDEPKQDDDHELQELRRDALAHEILGPKMKAKVACTKFQPYKDLVALPPCIQKTVDIAQAVEVPKEVKQFVLDSREMLDVVDHETVQRFRSDDLVDKCKILLETTRTIEMFPHKVDCPEDWDQETISLNQRIKMLYLAFDDEPYAMLIHAKEGCAALLTPILKF